MPWEVLLTRQDGVCASGATALEYGIIVALVVLAVVLAITAFGGALSTFFDGIAAKAKLI